MGAAQQEPAMLTVHHLNNSRSQRVLWLLEELQLPYEVRRYERDAQTLRAPPELRAVHPLGKSPVISDGEITLAESGAILEYLADRYRPGELAPAPGTPERVPYVYWLHYAEGSLMPLLLLKLVFDRMETAPMPFIARPVARAIAEKGRQAAVTPELRTHLDYLEGALAQREWFAGPRFSAADIQLSFPIEAAQARGGLDGSRPRLMDWLARIHARPAYQRALERGGPFEIVR
jgi:glutathione S-transferase